MKFSVIVPAHNAGTTLNKTLDSLLSQTISDWEAIVLDDGSSDQTADIAAGFAQKNERFRFFQQKQKGKSAARNAALKKARFDWVLFLDSDDWILQDYLERMRNALRQRPELDAIHCGWKRVTFDGQEDVSMHCPPQTDLFEVFSRYCALPIHACIVRRSLVQAVGDFDETLHTSEDWDFWQRIARTGARFGAVPDVLARYRMSRGSASMDAGQLLTDGLCVIDRAHAADPRMAELHLVHGSGLPQKDSAAKKLLLLCWAAGILIGQKKSVGPLFQMLSNVRDPALSPHEVAWSIFQSVPIGMGETRSTWKKIWNELEASISDFLTFLQNHSQARGLAHRSLRALEHIVLDLFDDDLPASVGKTCRTSVEISQPILDVELQQQIEQLECRVKSNGKFLGQILLPAFDSIVPAYVLKDAIAADFAWPILGDFFERTIYPDLQFEEKGEGTSVYRGSVLLKTKSLRNDLESVNQIHEQVGWTVFLQEFWGRADWPIGLFFDRNSKTEHVREANEDQISIDLTQDLPTIHTSAETVEILITFCELPVGIISMRAENNEVHFNGLRARIISEWGYELCILAVREALLGKSLPFDSNLRSLLIAAKSSSTLALKEASAVRNTKFVLGRRSQGVFGSSASRRALLPANSELLQLATMHDEPVVETSRTSGGILYAPDWQEKPHRATNFISASGLPNSNISTEKLPILLYHRIAETGSTLNASYRLHPDLFEAQMRYLADGGFHCVSIEEWHQASRMQQPLPGKAMIITFDDGYIDFASIAWPILRKYGFTATVFLVADQIGRSNEWDRQLGEDISLLNWEEILQLQREGVLFGSHSCSHRPMLSLSPEDVVREAARSRLILEKGLQRPVTTIAYPHGSEDRIVHHIIGACGYLFGYTLRRGLCALNEPCLALPRIEISGSDTLRDFIGRIQGL